MASLHDLIYSQNSQSADTTKPQQHHQQHHQQPQDEVRHHDEDDNDEEGNASDRLYGMSEQSNKAAATQSNSAPDTVISGVVNSGVTTDVMERRRKRKRGRPAARRRQNNHHDDEQEEEEEVTWETPQEAALRIQRHKRRANYKVIKQRWRKRPYNLQREVDYGHSVLHMARKVLLLVQHEKKKPSATVVPTTNVTNTMSRMDSSDEEQQEALGSLWIAAQQDDSDGEGEEDENEDVVDEAEAWDYYQLGYDTPQRQDLQDFYYYDYPGKVEVQLDLDARRRRLEEMKNEVCIPPIGIKVSPKVEPLDYLQRNALDMTCFTHSTFYHQTNVRTMAARILTAGNAPRQLQDCLLRAIYSRGPSQMYGKEYHVLTQCMERGRDYIVWKQHTWKQPRVAARVLGLVTKDSFPHVGPANRIGYSLERYNVVERAGLEFTNSVIRLLSKGKVSDDDASEAELADPIIVEMNEIVNEETATCSSDKDVKSSDDSDQEDVKVKSEAMPEELKPDLDACCFRTLIPSDLEYAHVPGTTPPIPSLPLDETGIVLGGEDRFSRVHHTSNIDEAMYTLTMSALLARLAQGRLKNDARAVQDAQDQIMTFAEEVIDNNVVLLSKMHGSRRKRHEQPSPMYYRAIMGYSSFVANSGCSFDRQVHSTTPTLPGSVDDRGAADKDGITKPWLNMDRVAQTMYEQCSVCPTSSSLTIFPRIHLVTALAFLASHLPASAAEILSRPFDGLPHRTPFDIMRKTLEHLEENHVLTDSRVVMHASGDMLYVGHLEHVVHQATEMFRRAATMDAADLFAHAWYVSGLAASLLLCSGNAIDGKAHIRPSSKTQDAEYDIIFSQNDDDIASQTYEVRQQMPKFGDLRSDVASAVKKLMRLANEQQSLRGHLIAASALEWKQVVALLVGPRPCEGKKSVWSEIQSMHSYHATQWAVKEQSLSTAALVKEMVRHERASKDTWRDIIASSVENDPSDVNAWRRLVASMGPVAVTVSDQRRDECKQCVECRKLNKGLNVDHAMATKRKASKAWWGFDRASWWDSHVLFLERVSASAKVSEIAAVRSALEKRLVADHLLNIGVQQEEEVQEDDAVSSPTNRFDMRWLDVQEMSLDEEGDNNEQAVDYDSLLPTTFVEAVTATKASNDTPPSLVFEDESDLRLEIICYKIILACHLYSVSHRLVMDGIWLLARGCWKTKTIVECNELQCLLWLSSQGLDITQIMLDRPTSQCPSKTPGTKISRPRRASKRLTLFSGMEL